MSNLPKREELYPVELHAVAPGVVIPVVPSVVTLLDNTTALLAASPGPGNIYTSSGFAIQNYEFVCGTCFADQSGTLSIEYSPDNGVNWDGLETMAYLANQQLTFKAFCYTTIARIVFTNTSIAPQTVFRLYVFGN